MSVRGRGGRTLTEKEEAMARTLIGTLKWLASVRRPELFYWFCQGLSFVNRDKTVAILEMINHIIP